MTSNGSYAERLKYIYNVLMISQQHYLKWKENTLFNGQHLAELLREANKIDFTENSFVVFVCQKIVKAMKSGHICLRPYQENTNCELEYIEYTNATEPLKNNNIAVSFQENTVIISIKSFLNSNIVDDKRVFDNLEHILTKNNYDNVIIDIRGNGRWN